MGKGMRWLRVLCVCAMLCIFATLLTAAAESPETRTVESLLKTRVAILNNMLTGNITCSEGQEQLKKVETDALYTKDVVLHYEAKIRWNCVGYDGAYVDTATYQIGVSCKEGTYRLISIEIL